MDVDNGLRRVRGALGMALVWGACGFALAVVAMAAFAVLSVVGIIPPVLSWSEAFFVAFRVGMVGAVAGTAVSTFMGLRYYGRRLPELSWVRFGVAGGVVTGLFVPLFLQTMNLLSGDGLVPWELVLDDGLRMAVFGSVVAGGSLKMAQLAEAALPRGTEDRVGRLEDEEPLALQGEREAP